LNQTQCVPVEKCDPKSIAQSNGACKTCRSIYPQIPTANFGHTACVLPRNCEEYTTAIEDQCQNCSILNASRPFSTASREECVEIINCTEGTIGVIKDCRYCYEIDAINKYANINHTKCVQQNECGLGFYVDLVTYQCKPCPTGTFTAP